jgi:hypothetical protein
VCLALVSEAAMRSLRPSRSPAQVRVQDRGHRQHTENMGLDTTEGDETSASAEVSGIKKGACYSGMNLCFLILSCLIFESSVDRGIPSFAAAPSGPATFPLLSVRAVSMISLS